MKRQPHFNNFTFSHTWLKVKLYGKVIQPNPICVKLSAITCSSAVGCNSLALNVHNILLGNMIRTICGEKVHCRFLTFSFKTRIHVFHVVLIIFCQKPIFFLHRSPPKTTNCVDCGCCSPTADKTKPTIWFSESFKIVLRYRPSLYVWVIFQLQVCSSKTSIDFCF